MLSFPGTTHAQSDNCVKNGEPSIPIDEILNVKYAPAYAMSFFSAVTYSYTNIDASEGDQDVAELVEQSAQQLVLS